MCFGKSHHKQFGGEESFYCASWSCVSTGHIEWVAPYTKDFITLTRTTGPTLACNLQKVNDEIKGNCNPVTLEFTEAGKTGVGWEAGLSWGVCLYEKFCLGAQDPGAIFMVRLIQRVPSVPIGPNPEIGPHPQPQQLPILAPAWRTVSLVPSEAATTRTSSGPKITPEPDSNPLLTLLEWSFMIFNASRPELTKFCWLCYDTVPPY